MSSFNQQLLNKNRLIELNKKKPLETKGVYITKNKSLEAVIKTTAKCMQSGSGGVEHLENDIEGIKQSLEADEFILVADNMESIRDYKCIKKIKTPIHIILSGAAERVNVQYLDLARQTNGSLRTINTGSIILTRSKKKNIYLLKKKYSFENGRFHFVYNISKIYK